MATLNRSAMASLLKAMISGGTRYQFVDKTGLSYSTISRYVQVFKRNELLYIDLWIRGPCFRWIPVFRLKTEPYEKDAPKPPPEPNGEAAKRYRKKKAREKMGVWGI